MKKITIASLILSFLCGCSDSGTNNIQNKYTVESNSTYQFKDMSFIVCKGWIIDHSDNEKLTIEANGGELNIGTRDESVNQAILYFDRQHAKDEGMGLPESDGYIDVEIGGQPAKWGSYGYNDALNSESDNAGLKRADVVGLVPYNNQVYYLSYSISFFDRKAADEPLKEFEVFDKSISFK